MHGGLGTFFMFITQKDAFLRPFPRFLCNFRRKGGGGSEHPPTAAGDRIEIFGVYEGKFAAEGWGAKGSEDPHEIFGVYHPKRCIFKAFFSIFI